VAWARDLRSLGIDAEPHAPLPEGVLDAVARPEERPQLRHAAEAGVNGDRLLFCAKEAVYKAWYPLGRQILDFVDLAVALSADGTFAARLKVRGPVPSLSGRWAVAGDLLLAAVVVRPRGAPVRGGSAPPG
jgi:4'-phosphopantetheinyl transferase EntD